MKTKLTPVDYLGFTAVDRRFSTAMLPWILTEIRRRGSIDKLCLGVEGGVLQAFDVNFELQFTHKLQNIMRFTQVQSNPTEFLYLLKDSKDPLLFCYLFQAGTPEEVSELFGQMRDLAPHGGSLTSLGGEQAKGKGVPEKTKVTTPGASSPASLLQRPQAASSVATNRGFQSARAQQSAIENSVLQNASAKSGNQGGMAQSKSYNAGLNKSGSSLAGENISSASSMARSHSNAANLTSLCADISPCNSHFFEVLYIGKIKVSHKKVPETLIDDALTKFQQFEVEKIKAAQMRRNSLLSSQADSVASNNSSLESLVSQNQTKRVEFAPLPLVYKKNVENLSLSNDETLDHRIKEGFVSPSKAVKKLSWENQKPDKEKCVNEKSVDEEFDELSTERVQKKEDAPLTLNKRSLPVALEPNVIILNWPQNENNQNLTTLKEDDDESSELPSEPSVKVKDVPKQIDITSKLEYGKKMLEAALEKNLNSPITSDDNIPALNAWEIKKSMSLEFKEVGIKESGKLSMPSVMDSSSMDSNISESKDYFKDSYQEKASLKSKLPENKPFTRDRSASIGTLNLHKTPIAHLIGDQNRTMLFQVGRSDLRLISPDRKQVLLHRQLRDVASCVQGLRGPDHFGFICREAGAESFVGYVFKCESAGVASDVVGAITQAFVAHAEMVKQGKERSPIFSCEHCPMVWYHKLCQDLEGISDKRMHPMILRRIEQLSDEEQTQIVTKYQGGTEDLYEVGEHNAFLMMLLRAHCEAKQQRHVHDTAENRSEFLNQYLGGSTIFMKAKRSLSSSFDHLLKRKASKDDLGILPKDWKKETSPMNHSGTPTRDSNMDLHLDTNQPTKSGAIPPTMIRVRSPSISEGKDFAAANGNQNTVPDLPGLGQAQNGKDFYHDTSPSPQLKSPMMDIFMKIGSSPSTKAPSPQESVEGEGKGQPVGSWRQAIFNRVTQQGLELQEDDNSNSSIPTGNELLRRPSSFTNLNQLQQRKRDKAELRELWKKGINQAILLIRMEKENARLRARQEVSAVKRIKLEYEDIGGCAHENSKVWDMLTAPRESRISTRVDSHMLLQAIRHGVPRAKRGEVWYFLAEQFCLRQPPPDVKLFPNYSTPYEALLKQLTSHQHAILIDLGRTFPSHTYFSSPMGPGQLALFNLLKAYSLLDPEVGYCQGLSFVAGVLLLHLEEAEAFFMLRHLMFRRGLRKQYLPDMVALQIELYQLSRLLKDHIPELYEKFDSYDVSPTLYAAPWILTIFTSQFPLGFVTRVFDLLFHESSEVIFRVAIALLDIHKDGLMLCDSFEEIMEYLKHKMPNIDKTMLDKVIKLAFTLDFGRQLNEYHVEYNVLQEEMAAIAPKMEALNVLEKQNKKLVQQNMHLMEQLEDSLNKASTIQLSQSRLENQVKTLEQTVASLARYIGTTHDKKIELPNDIKRLCQQVQQNDRKTLGALGQKLGQSWSSKFSSTEFTNSNLNGGHLLMHSEESGSDPDEKSTGDKTTRKHGILKTGLSAPNLFHKIGEPKKDEPPKAKTPESEQILEKKRQYLSMKKSYSCNAGLMANPKPDALHDVKQDSVGSLGKSSSNFKSFPLKVLDESMEYNEYLDKPKEIDNKNYDILKSTNLSNASTISISSGSSHHSDSLVQSTIKCDAAKPKTSGFFAHSHEQIRQEKLQAEQMKREFDENLRRLDARLSPHHFHHEQDELFKPDMLSPVSRNAGVCPSEVSAKLSNNDITQFNFESKTCNPNLDSGLGTPISPNERSLHGNAKFDMNSTKASEKAEPCENITNHPLIGCDDDIKFDVHATKLKSLRPTRLGHTGSVSSGLGSGDSRN